MELVFPRAEDAPSAAAAAKAPSKRGATGKRKGPNLESMHAVGSSKRVTGTIPYHMWGDRQNADIQSYFERKISSQRNEKGCYRWAGKGKIGSNGATASFCGVKYDAQKLFYIANNPGAGMQEKIVASCGDKQCLTIEHLSAASASASARRPGVRYRTICYNLEQWRELQGRGATIEDEMLETTEPCHVGQ